MAENENDGVPRDALGRVDWVKFATENLPGLVCDEMERRQKLRLEAEWNANNAPPIYTPAEMRESFKLPPYSDGGVSYLDAPRRPWYKRIFRK